MEMIQQAIEVLKKGGTLLYPTDTIWGLGCDAKDEAAVEKIADLKNRPENKSFIVLVDSVAMLERYVSDFPDVCYDLIDFAEKPLTIIYDNVNGIATNVLAKDGSVGIRVTKDPICQQLIRGIRGPLLSTSANLSGEPSPTCFDDINNIIKKGVDFTIEMRQNERCTKPSSILKIGRDQSIQVIRK
jgi:L-threonylcarbamoyladenylate synthase